MIKYILMVGAIAFSTSLSAKDICSGFVSSINYEKIESFFQIMGEWEGSTQWDGDDVTAHALIESDDKDRLYVILEVFNKEGDSIFTSPRVRFKICLSEVDSEQVLKISGFGLKGTIFITDEDNIILEGKAAGEEITLKATRI